MPVTDEQSDALKDELKDKDFDTAIAMLDDANAKVHVWSAPDGVGSPGKWGVCFIFKPGDHDESEVVEILQAEYGPGDYPIQIKSKRKDKGPKILWQKTLHITPRKFNPRAEPLVAAALNPAPADGLLATAIENQTRMLGEVLGKLSQPPPAPPSTIEVAKDLAAFKDLFSDNRPSPIEMFREMMEFKTLLMDESGADDNPLTAAIRMLEKLAPEIGKAAEAGLPVEAARRPQASADGAAPAAVKSPEPPPASGSDAQPAADVVDDTAGDEVEPNQEEVDAAFAFFAKTYLMAALHLLSQKAPPGSVAEWLVRHMGGNEKMIRQVGIVISDDQMVQRLAGFDAGVMDAATWFDLVADHLAFALWPEHNPDPAMLDATKSATTDEKTDAGSIIDADSPAEHDQAPIDEVDTKSHEEIIRDAERIDPSGTGNNNDA